MTNARLPLLDFLRGLALLGMIAYHAAYDLEQYWNFQIDTGSGSWKIFARAVAILFLLISGIAMGLSEERLLSLPFKDRWLRRLRRAALTGVAALLVSLITFAVDAETFVRFGILHLLAAARLLLPAFALLPVPWIVLSSAGIFALSLTQPWSGPSLLLPIGFLPEDFVSVDFYPVIPWIAPVLFGLFLQRTALLQRFFVLPIPASARWIAFGGRHTLLLYLLHQPILIAVLSVLIGKPNF